jgi:zinc and cadmium transporter
MILVAILLGTLTAGIGSVFVAALLSFGVLARYTQHMLSMAAGALMGTAFLHLLPEAFESDVGPHRLFLTLLLGVVFFFLLDKAELWHHGHEHHHGPHAHDDGQDHKHDHGHGHQKHSTHQHAHTHNHHEHHTDHHAGHAPGSWAVLAGDSVHCFGDGILMASAFMADVRLGVIAALAVLAHEVPHHMGDLVVLGRGAVSRQAAVLKVALAGAVTMLGGLVGYWLVEQLREFLPYFLVMASSSFMYVALADLIPQLQKRLSLRQTLAQIGWLFAGMGMVTLMSLVTHTH